MTQYLKPFAFGLFTLCLSFSALAQVDVISEKDGRDVLSFSTVERVPVAAGCESATGGQEIRECFQYQILKQVAQNFKYPEEDRRKGVQGRIYINFIVEKDASISEVEVLRGVSESLDREGIRVVKGLKLVKAAQQRGKPVRMSFTLPINAKLSDQNSKKEAK